MRKCFKILGALALTAVTALGITSCGQAGGNQKVKIFLGVQQDNDPNTKAVFNILNDLKDDLNFEYEYKVLNARDSVANLNEFNDKINMGYKGIISMADLDKAQAEELIQSCEENDAYYVGYKSDMPNAMRSDKVKNSPNYLGSTSDGELDWSLRAERLFNAISQSTDRKIVLASFKPAYFPNATVALSKFKELVENWNNTHADDKFEYSTYNNGSNSWECPFGDLPEAEKVNLKNNGVQAIVAMNSVAKYVMPNLDPSIHLYNVGYDSSYDTKFGADKQLRCEGASPADHIILPLVRILKAVRGAEPVAVNNKIVVGNYIYMTKIEDFQKLQKVCINFRENQNLDACLFTKQQVSDLLNKSDDELKTLCESWTTDYVLGLNK